MKAKVDKQKQPVVSVIMGSKSDWIINIIAGAFLLALFASFANGQAEKGYKATIKGTVVAEYNTLVPCGWHVCGLSLVVRLDKQSPEKYVVVHITYMDNHSLPQRGKPLELTKRAMRWKFSAVSKDKESVPLQQYWNIIDEKGKDMRAEVKAPAWSLLKGAEKEVLPFGQPIRNYEVDVGKFKPLR